MTDPKPRYEQNARRLWAVWSYALAAATAVLAACLYGVTQ